MKRIQKKSVSSEWNRGEIGLRNPLWLMMLFCSLIERSVAEGGTGSDTEVTVRQGLLVQHESESDLIERNTRHKNGEFPFTLGGDAVFLIFLVG